MKVMTLRSPGGLDNLALVERDRPEPGPSEILVRVHANSLNYHDYVVAAGVLPVADGRVMMSDGAGEVVAIGDDVTLVYPGEKVMSTYYPNWQKGLAEPSFQMFKPGENVDGYASEYVVVPENWVTRIPRGFSFAEAATLPCAGLTAWRGVVIEGKVSPGDVVLVQGTGGVSIFALQFAKAAGARVIATSSSEAKLERLRELGADHVINYKETREWGRRVKELTGGRGADIVIETGGAGTLTQSLLAAATNGRVILIGVLTGISGDFPVALAFHSQLTIKGVAVGSREDQLSMIRGIEANDIRPVIDSIRPLEGLADAYREQEAYRHFGKLCIEL